MKPSLLILAAVALAASYLWSQSSGVITLPAPPTTIAGCAWPAAPNSVTAGTQTCIYGTAASPGLAIAVNGGAFVAVPMGQATAGVTSLNGKTGALTVTATATAPAVTVVAQ
jgi:hypothetical protein